jgi:ATP-binding cassette subfamily F protein 3
VLSGGEKARLALAKMLVRPAALLCLDEPTNHLDLASREVLEEALAAFPGTIVFISHDRYFINRIATAVVEVSGGTLAAYPGGYDDYVEARTRAAAAPAAPRTAPPAPPDRGAARRERRAAGAPAPAGAGEMRRRLAQVEREVSELEARLRGLGETLGDPALYADGERARAAAQELKKSEERMAGLLREWETLSTTLADRG